MILCKCGCRNEIKIRPWHKLWYETIIFNRYYREQIYENLA